MLKNYYSLKGGESGEARLLVFASAGRRADEIPVRK
jgi:hypothetical protein